MDKERNSFYSFSYFIMRFCNENMKEKILESLEDYDDVSERAKRFGKPLSRINAIFITGLCGYIFYNLVTRNLWFIALNVSLLLSCVLFVESLPKHEIKFVSQYNIQQEWKEEIRLPTRGISFLVHLFLLKDTKEDLEADIKYLMQVNDNRKESEIKVLEEKLLTKIDNEYKKILEDIENNIKNSKRLEQQLEEPGSHFEKRLQNYKPFRKKYRSNRDLTECWIDLLDLDLKLEILKETKKAEEKDLLKIYLILNGQKILPKC
jgi:hypothetical protein